MMISPNFPIGGMCDRFLEGNSHDWGTKPPTIFLGSQIDFDEFHAVFLTQI